jgi:phosphomannomutase
MEDMPLTGHFIQNRGSTINWCPIGRNAVTGDRQQFIALDHLYSLRKGQLPLIRNDLLQAGVDDITIKLGGSTSFDIYPRGWDKTFAIQHFSKETEFWFIGDSCTPDGNDYELFSLLREDRRAFQVESFRDTIEIVEELIETEFRRYE